MIGRRSGNRIARSFGTQSRLIEMTPGKMSSAAPAKIVGIEHRWQMPPEIIDQRADQRDRALRAIAAIILDIENRAMLRDGSFRPEQGLGLHPLDIDLHEREPRKPKCVERHDRHALAHAALAPSDTLPKLNRVE